MSSPTASSVLQNQVACGQSKYLSKSLTSSSLEVLLRKSHRYQFCLFLGVFSAQAGCFQHLLQSRYRLPRRLYCCPKSKVLQACHADICLEDIPQGQQGILFFTGLISAALISSVLHCSRVFPFIRSPSCNSGFSPVMSVASFKSILKRYLCASFSPKNFPSRSITTNSVFESAVIPQVESVSLF